MRYGGNTSCIEYRCGDDIIILDAGTGLRALGQSLLKEFKNKPLNLTLLLTHTHWDHIQGLPFFGPIYNPRCRLRILGCEGARKGLVAALTGQMESTYFPVPFSKLPSNIEIEELHDFNFAVGDVLVRAQREPSRRLRRLSAVFARRTCRLFSRHRTAHRRRRP